MRIEKSCFGVIPNRLPVGVNPKYAGTEISNYELIADNGMSVVISEYGAVIVSINVPDKTGKVDNVILGYDDLWGYLCNELCFGAPIGRGANRTDKAKFSINGVEYRLSVNDGPNNLHSDGKDNYFRRPFDTIDFGADSEKAYVKLHLFSPHMDQGYPGNLHLFITYTLDNKGALEITYNAKSDMDTLFAITNHSYFNLGGEQSGNALDSLVWIDADRVTKLNKAKISTGSYFDVADGPFDFRKEKALKTDFHAKHPMLPKGYDCNFVLNNNGKLAEVAYMKHPSNGRKMTVATDLPGMQLYTGNYVAVKGCKGRFYKEYHGICFETQQFPNAINIPEFPSPIIKAGEEYETKTVYTFTVE